MSVDTKEWRDHAERWCSGNEKPDDLVMVPKHLKAAADEVDRLKEEKRVFDGTVWGDLHRKHEALLAAAKEAIDGPSLRPLEAAIAACGGGDE